MSKIAKRMMSTVMPIFMAVVMLLSSNLYVEAANNVVEKEEVSINDDRRFEYVIIKENISVGDEYNSKPISVDEDLRINIYCTFDIDIESIIEFMEIHGLERPRTFTMEVKECETGKILGTIESIEIPDTEFSILGINVKEGTDIQVSFFINNSEPYDLLGNAIITYGYYSVY